jgi:hypothetical protein
VNPMDVANIRSVGGIRQKNIRKRAVKRAVRWLKDLQAWKGRGDIELDSLFPSLKVRESAVGADWRGCIELRFPSVGSYATKLVSHHLCPIECSLIAARDKTQFISNSSLPDLTTTSY